MNKQLQDFARAELKTGLAELPEENHRTFKLMYARDNGKRSVVDAVAMPINDVVDLMPPEQLDWAMQQVKASLDKMPNVELTGDPQPHRGASSEQSERKLTEMLGDGDEMHEMRTRQASDRVPQALGAEHWPCRMVQSVLR